MSVYKFENARVVFPSETVQANNPNTVFTIKGTTVTDENGNRLGLKSKTITISMVKSAGFDYDPDTGILSLPDGRRGRRITPGAKKADILAAISNAKK